MEFRLDGWRRAGESIGLTRLRCSAVASWGLLVTTALLLPGPLDVPGRVAVAEDAPPAYPDLAALEARLADFARRHPDSFAFRELARSAGGRPIWLAVLAKPGETPPDDRPALLVVAGLDGAHLLGTDLALAATSHFLEGPEDVRALLEDRTIYVVPRANPDGRERFRTHPSSGRSGNARPIDADRDGAADEDPPADLDGDGLVTWIRAPDPEGEYRADPDEAGLVVKADRAKGEKGVWKLYREGSDADLDEEVAEEPASGVDVARNFPHRFAFAQDASGPYPGSEPESLALLDFIASHRNIAIQITYGLDDTLLEDPASEDAKSGEAATKVDPADIPWFKKAGEIYRDLTGAKGKNRPVEGGSFHEWAYYQGGILSVAARGWHFLDWYETEVRPAEGEKKEGAAPKEPSEDGKRLLYARALGTGYAPWAPFDHPALGKVEIGGFVPGFETNPPEAAVAALATKHAPFAARLAALLPSVSLETPAIRPLGAGLFEVSGAVTNDGFLPLSVAQGKRARRPGPVVVRLEGEFELVGGRPEGYRQYVIWDVAGSGGRFEFAWIVKNPRFLAVTLSSRRGFAARQEVEVR